MAPSGEALRHRRPDGLAAARQAGLYWEVQRDAYRTDDFVRFVRDLRRQLRTRLLVVWDNLRGHSAAEKCFRGKGVVFSHLPPYAPDLCPVEPVWGHTKGTALANWAPDDTDELEEAVHNHLADLNHTPKLL